MSFAAARQQFEYINWTNINLSSHISGAEQRSRAYLETEVVTNTEFRAGRKAEAPTVQQKYQIVGNGK